MSAKNKGTGASSTQTRATAPVSNKAPRIMVTDSNRSVEWHVEACGGMVVKAGYSPESAVRDLALCDGLLITGGGDVNPDLYADKRHPHVYGVSASRDARELALLGAARDLGIPVMGICRGLQIITVEAGGTLYQHLPDKVKHDLHGCNMMPVQTAKGSLVRRTLGANPTMLHLHHQSLRRTPKGFAITARHRDGTVEAIESLDGRVVAVQFHPESVMGSGEKHTGWRLFDAFTDACTRHRRRVLREGRNDLRDPAYYLKRWPVAEEALKVRPAYVAKPWAGSSTSSTSTKADDKGGTVSTLPVKQAVESSERPVAFCPTHGLAFDFYKDWQDHCDWYGCD